jgi:hypothetical protein
MAERTPMMFGAAHRSDDAVNSRIGTHLLPGMPTLLYVWMAASSVDTFPRIGRSVRSRR